MIDIRFYVSGQTPRYIKAGKDIKDLLEGNYEGQYSFEIINLTENPQRAEEDNIFVTPTLLRASPEPVKKVVGDFSNKEIVMKALDGFK